MKRTIRLALLLLLGQGVAFAQPTARVQAIHNAPDPELEVVDLYVAGQLILDDVAFRTASPYMDVPAGFPLTGGIAPSNSTGPGDVFFEFTFTLTPGETYQFIAVGVRDPGEFLPNPDGRDIGLDILVNDEAREVAENPSEIDVLSVHGTTDAPTVDVLLGVIPRMNQLGPFVFGDDLSYSDFSAYVAIDFQTVPLHVVASDGSPFSYLFDVVKPDFGDAVTVLTSGFVDPASNQNGSEMAILAVFGDGTAQVIGQAPTSIESDATVHAFTLHANYPNPFNPSTNITFDLESPSRLFVEVFDVLGRRVMDVDAGFYTAGARHQFQLDASSLASGTYLYRVLAHMDHDVVAQTGRMTLVK